MAKVHKTSAEVKSAIQRKSAYSLPNNPTDSGFKASDIRNAFYKPIIDITNSALTEIDRIVEELNGVLGLATKDVDAIENVAGLNYHGSDGLIYSFNGSAFTVSGNDELEGEVSIPSSVFYQDKYYPVVAIAANAFSGSKITKAEIASSVETVGEKAFYASTLTSVKFYGSASIGANAFYAGRVAFSVPKEYLSAYESSLASYKKTLVGFDTIANNALNIAALFKDKVDKIVGESANERAYIISKTGAQITRKLVTTPTDGEIPVYLTGGRIPVKTPQTDDDATPKGYVEDRLESMGAYIAFSIDPTNYKMTIQLKNEDGTVLSSGSVDLPLESMILGAKYANGILSLNIKTADGSMNNTVIDVNISDLISGLVSDTTFNAEVGRLDGRINQANNAHQALVAEVDQKEIYAHAAFHSEEAETARNYTKGGKTDKKFREIEAIGATNLSLSLDKDYKLTVKLLNKKGVVIADGMVDLPIESLITKASYSNKILTLTFQSGDTLKVDISSIISGLVPDARTINGKNLKADITLTASDVGAYAKGETFNKSEVTNLLGNQKQELLVGIEEHQVVGYAYSSTEAEKASGYTKGGGIDKALKALDKRLSTLEDK